MGAAIDSLRLPIAPFYRVGNSASLLYATSGSAQDYAQVRASLCTFLHVKHGMDLIIQICFNIIPFQYTDLEI